MVLLRLIMKKIKAKKSYGQHFLNSESIAKEIAYSLQKVEGHKNVLEIGPGKGMLTKYLLEQDINLKVVEADQDMVDYLKENLSIDEKAIVFFDFIRANMQRFFEEQPFYIIGNFPYNISSQIVFKMLDSRDLVPELVGMFQKEMAERIIAPPGSKTYGVISVLTQAYYEGEMVLYVDPESFTPPPKVNSAVIRLKRKKNYELPCNETLFRTVVKLSFSQRRKMLRNTIKSIIGSHEMLSNDFYNKRPEQLSVEDFIDITNKIEKIQEK